MKPFLFKITFYFILFLFSCSNKEDDIDDNHPIVENEVDFYLTKFDGSEKLQKQNQILAFGSNYNMYSNVVIDASQTFQTIDGFGFSLTGGSAEMINSLSPQTKANLLQELFGNQTNSIGVSYLRISVGASDLDANAFSYNDMPSGQTDVNLTNFSLGPDLVNLVPLLKEILLINPNLKIMASPWSAPVWMKTNNSTIGGSLNPDYYGVYANYLVKYIQSMKIQGINIDAITVQNEPLHDGNNPSMHMTSQEQTNFIKNNLGPTFQTNNITTKIVIYDHNCDKPEYPINVLNDAVAKSYINGSAFHLYAGNISALSTVKNAHPTKDVYFTEQYTSSDGQFGGDLVWHLQNVVIGSMRNWSKNALEWNLANNASYGPHTQGGCTVCKGGLTISGDNITRNVSYYIIGHASKFVPTGSIRIGSNFVGNVHNVAFKTPQNKYVLIAVNTGNTTEIFNVKFNSKWFSSSLQAGEVGTYIW